MKRIILPSTVTRIELPVGRVLLLLLGLFLCVFCGASDTGKAGVKQSSPACSVPNPIVPTFADGYYETLHKGNASWVVQLPGVESGVLSVTPSNDAYHTKVHLYAEESQVASDQIPTCTDITRAKDAAGVLMVLPGKQQIDKMLPFPVGRYFVAVTCLTTDIMHPAELCEFSLSIGTGAKANARQRLGAGAEMAGIAYPGVPMQYLYKALEEEADGGVCGARHRDGAQKLRITVYPRDATSSHGLRLLVQKGRQPSRADHLEATPGWFSGQVVSVPEVQCQDEYYITVLKTAGRQPLPYVLSVSLPRFVERVQLGHPVFGAVSDGHSAFFKVLISRERTDIEVYLTNISGEVEMFLAHAEVQQRPSRETNFTWHAVQTDDTHIIVPPNDTDRSKHPTGWFHIGVTARSGSAAFSVVAFAEQHVDNWDEEGDVSDQMTISWTQLFLGLPQILPAEPRKPGLFLFYSQLAVRELRIELDTLSGRTPELCAQVCGSDPHMCPYISRFQTQRHFDEGKEIPPAVPNPEEMAVADCLSAALKSSARHQVATVQAPCSACWFAILVTAPFGRSSFRIRLGAKGVAHPLIAGRPFRGHVNANESALLLVYDIPEEVLLRRTSSGNATLNFNVVPNYGRPAWMVRERTENGTMLFCSHMTGRDDFQLSFPPETLLKSSHGLLPAMPSTFFITVSSLSAFSEFTISLSWTMAGFPLGNIGNLTKLYSGIVYHGTLLDGMADAYVYRPEELPDTLDPLEQLFGHTKSIKDLDITASIVPRSSDRCRILLTVIDKADLNNEVEGYIHDARAFAAGNVSSRQWEGTRANDHFLRVHHARTSHEDQSSSTFLVVVLPVPPHGPRIKYELEMGTFHSVEELAANGHMYPGRINAGDTMLYQIRTGEVDKHLSISLTVSYGDANLYLSGSPEVSGEKYDMKAEVSGSDLIWVHKDSPLSKAACKQHNCTYYVAVVGVAAQTRFRISAITQDGRPIPLVANEPRPVNLRAGSREFYYFMLERPWRNVTVALNAAGGTLRGMRMIVTTAEQARHPGVQSMQLEDHADAEGQPFAGIWVVSMDAETVGKRCSVVAASKDVGCAMLVLVVSSGVVGDIMLQVREHGQGNHSFWKGDGAAIDVQSGREYQEIMATGDLELYFRLKLIADRTNVSITVMSWLGGCYTMMKAQLPNGTILPYDADPIMRRISAKLLDVAPTTETDMVLFSVQRAQADGMCLLSIQVHTSDDFDFGDEVGSTAPGMSTTSKGGRTDSFLTSATTTGRPPVDLQQDIAPTKLRMNVPMLSSASEPMVFLFESIVELWEPGLNEEDAPDPSEERGHLRVRVRSLAGAIKVKAAYLTATCKSCREVRDLRRQYASALESAEVVQPHFVQSLHEYLHEVTGESIQDACGRKPTCQVLLSIESATPDGWADFQVRAIDEREKDSALHTLVEGIAARGSLAMSADGEAMRFQFFIGNPTAKVRIALTCTEPVDTFSCKQLDFSADAGESAGADYPAKPQYTSRLHDTVHVIEVQPQVRPSGQEDARPAEGVCWVPCAVTLQVRLLPQASDAGKQRVAFSVVASREMEYKLLPAGEAVDGFAEPVKPEYFVYDSRRSISLSSIVLQIPYNKQDPHASLVSMFVLGCTQASQDAAMLSSPSERPSREYKSAEGIPNGHQQMVAFVHNPDSGSQHCYNRIAVVQYGLQSMPFKITALDWHLDSASQQLLRYGMPLQGLLLPEQPCRFVFPVADKEQPKATMRLSLEVCAGAVHVELKHDTEGHNAVRSYDHAFRDVDVPGSDWYVTVTAGEGKAASFILTSSDGSGQQLRLPPEPDLIITQLDDTSVLLEWSISQLCESSGSCRGSDSDPLVEYEVFWLQSGSVSANFSSVCSLYSVLSSSHISQSPTGSRRSMQIHNLKQGTAYQFAVVAKSREGGLSSAYRSRVFRMWREELRESSGSTIEMLVLMCAIFAAGTVIYQCWKPLRALAVEPIWHRYTIHEHRRLLAERRSSAQTSIFGQPSSEQQGDTERPLLRVFRR